MSSAVRRERHHRRSIRPNIAGGDSDLLIGDALVEFLYGPQPTRREFELVRRRFYNIAPQLPVFKFGRLYAARRATLIQELAAREARRLAETNPIVSDATVLPALVKAVVEEATSIIFARFGMVEGATPDGSLSARAQ